MLKDRLLFQKAVRLGQLVVGHRRQQVMREVVTVVSRMDEAAPETVARHVAREGEHATRLKAAVVEQTDGLVTNASQRDNLLAFITDSGVMIRAGCFFDTRAKFELRLASTHGDNQHAQEYRAALVLIDKHAELWTPKVDAVEPVSEVQS